MIFYAQLPPKTITAQTGLNANTVATIKRRLLQRLADQLHASGQTGDAHTPPDNLFTAAWEAARPSCPKRSTIGAYLLGSLDPDWHAYVRFHLEELGCRFCVANFQDLKHESETQAADAHHESLSARILRSSVGFLPPA